MWDRLSDQDQASLGSKTICKGYQQTTKVGTGRKRVRQFWDSGIKIKQQTC